MLLFCSYTSLADIADHLFPPIRGTDDHVVNDEYSNFNFWREPVQDICIDELLLDTSTTSATKTSPKAQKEKKQKGGDPPTGRTSSSGLGTIPEK